MAFLNEIEGKIVDELRSGPKTTRQISDNLKINWATADKYLKYLEGFGRVKSKETTRKYFYLKQKENFFDLPLTKEQESKIKKIFEIINNTKKVTKTQAQKILFQVNKKLDLNIPVGWYKFGPISVMPYEENNMGSSYNFSNKQISFIKETTQNYAKLDNFDLEDKIYGQENNDLYKKRKQIISMRFQDENDEDFHEHKNKISMHLMDFLKLVPSEAKDLTEDFVRSTLLIGWNVKTRGLFDQLWGFIAKINFKNSISKYYDYNIDLYFKETEKEELHLNITNIVRSHMDSKHIQDKRFQEWKS
ncbi:MAG: helix-turn-helix domain-containing protein [Candidatus Woesearchaeota archaeon]